MLLTLFLICHAIKDNTWLRLICTPKADSVYHFKPFFSTGREESVIGHIALKLEDLTTEGYIKKSPWQNTKKRDQWTTLFHIQWSRRTKQNENEQLNQRYLKLNSHWKAGPLFVADTSRRLASCRLKNCVSVQILFTTGRAQIHSEIEGNNCLHQKKSCQRPFLSLYSFWFFSSFDLCLFWLH